MRLEHRVFARRIFGSLMAGAIGFGATQAFAAPTSNPGCSMNDPEFCEAPYCTWENDFWCAEGCRDAWGEGYTGACDYWYGMKTCACWGGPATAD
ncbi:MAG TPA: hypothetical protein VGC13_07390 [Longimicrobium sp.]|jgi:hypothetical protein|uniref:hypothetical protein n=1 Tax=Longimicrobium sp. TaxID=2029185 RepID=UPI002ED984BF